jgi:hypothetical protein
MMMMMMIYLIIIKFTDLTITDRWTLTNRRADDYSSPDQSLRGLFLVQNLDSLLFLPTLQYIVVY